jgi:hypothetical protein
MALKFFPQRKHLARLVPGLVAVSNSPQTGQRNLNHPSLIFDAIFRLSSINLSIGIELRSLNNSLHVNRLFIACLPDFLSFFSTAKMFFSNSPRKSVRDFSESTAKMAARGKTRREIRRVSPSRRLYTPVRTVFGSTVAHVFRIGVQFGVATTIFGETVGFSSFFGTTVPSLATAFALEVSGSAALLSAVGLSAPAAAAYVESGFAPPACDENQFQENPVANNRKIR